MKETSAADSVKLGEKLNLKTSKKKIVQRVEDGMFCWKEWKSIDGYNDSFTENSTGGQRKRIQKHSAEYQSDRRMKVGILD